MDLFFKWFSICSVGTTLGEYRSFLSAGRLKASPSIPLVVIIVLSSWTSGAKIRLSVFPFKSRNSKLYRDTPSFREYGGAQTIRNIISLLLLTDVVFDNPESKTEPERYSLWYIAMTDSTCTVCYSTWQYTQVLAVVVWWSCSEWSVFQSLSNMKTKYFCNTS